MVIHDFHFITSLAYAVVGAIFFACGSSMRFRFSLLRTEADRSFAFMATGVFVYACFLDHIADSLGMSEGVLWTTALFEAVVSVMVAAFLVYRAIERWKR